MKANKCSNGTSKRFLNVITGDYIGFLISRELTLADITVTYTYTARVQFDLYHLSIIFIIINFWNK